MRILVAEDDATSRWLLERVLRRWGHEIQSVESGAEALEILERPDSPQLAILDWLMPQLTGVDVCRQLRRSPSLCSKYLILLTSKGEKEDVVNGLEAGADDYITKPFNQDELRARIKAGLRIIELQSQLAERVAQLEASIAREKHLQGLLPICSYCKKIRDDRNYWHQVESYIVSHADVRFSHSVCPECVERVREEILKDK
ncbi:MAG: response regulator [Verrucomicrobia bacterium]|nr:response regulator [Verrucomicrobiota bacterium]MBI3869193.1 response regulator [Verrucomicrobiota bacterium]